MRILALDIGEKRIGLAISDPSGVIASPLRVIDATDLAAAKRLLTKVVEDYEVEKLLIGVPISLTGEEGRQAGRVRSLAARFTEHLGLETVYHDERLSSREAKRSLLEAGRGEREARGTVDMVAASLFLQSWLDAHRAPSMDKE